MSTRFLRRVGFVAAAVIPVVAAGVAAVGPTAAAPSGRHVLPGTAPTWANAHSRSGNASGSEQVHGRVWLQFNNQAQAVALAKSVSDPSSPLYRQFLTPAQFNARFQPTAAAVSAVTSWLKANGLTVTDAPSHNRWVDFSAPAAKVSKAFGVSYGRYTVKGSTYASPGADASIPDSLAPTVLTVTGLDTMPHLVTPAKSSPFPPPAGFRNAQPWSQTYGDTAAPSTVPSFQGQALPMAVQGYTPPQLRQIYNAGDPSIDGTGAIVAITDAYASPTIEYDINRYVADNDPGHPYATGQFEQRNASNFTHQNLCGGNGWYGEETMDIEAVHAVAPGATIRYYGAASCYDADLDGAILQALNDGADVVTNSWGEPESAVSLAAAHAESMIFMQAAAQGASVLFSSGDNGDWTANGTAPVDRDLPAANDWVTAVGGTSLGIGANDAGTPTLETGWGTHKYSLTDGAWKSQGFLYGAGGGTSDYFNLATDEDSPGNYQSALSGGPFRQYPDIALDADPTTGMLVGETQRFGNNKKSDSYDTFRLGGTSLSSPLFAGVVALAVQVNGGEGLGLLNPAIYGLYAAGGDNGIRDVTGLSSNQDKGNVRADYANGLDDTSGILYSVRTFNQNDNLEAAAGYDHSTGVGAPTTSFPSRLAGFTP